MERLAFESFASLALLGAFFVHAPTRRRRCRPFCSNIHSGMPYIY